MAEILPASNPHIEALAAQLLREGELVAYPTDTVYGLGAAASNDPAIRRLYTAKGRPPSKALPLLLADAAMASWVGDVTPVVHHLVSQFWPGPLTIVMHRAEGFHSLALAGENTVALRVPDHSLVRSIIREVGEPITGTSANRSGSRPPVSAAEVAFQMGELVALVIDDGPARRGVESTIVDTTQPGGAMILREGAVTREEIARALGDRMAKTLE